MNKDLIVKNKAIVIIVIFATISVLGYSTWLLVSTKSNNYPFRVSGATLLEYDSVTHTSSLFSQSFEVVIQTDNDQFSVRHTETIMVYNFKTTGMSVTGITTDDYQVINSTIVMLTVLIDPNVEKTISLVSSLANEDEINFVLIGDTQGTFDVLDNFLSSSTIQTKDFVLLLGDITSTGSVDQFERYQRILRNSPVVFFPTPGNHDVKESNSTTLYERFFGTPNYYFFANNYLFISLDSSGMVFSQNSLNYLRQLLSMYPTSPKVIFTHVPAIDIRGKDHCIINKSNADEFLGIIKGNNVKLVVNGHIHYYDAYNNSETIFITSGGGGGILHEPPEMGGYHHITEVTISQDNITFSPYLITVTREQPLIELYIDDNLKVTYSIPDLISNFELISGNSSFQNQLGNYRGYGRYTGVRIGDLINHIGGMDPDMLVEIEAIDHFKGYYSYENIFPNETFYELQGDFILALSCNDSLEWSDGPRTVFLAPDEVYSNDDCKLTSLYPYGWYRYPSAGFRWIRWVKSIRLVTTNH